ncbi:efflux RND transporter periplasmic adaptor subunit [Desulfobulbus alkaliphilus]|uniref:efflux RND transporter periplasmic adaptor subunit n=1 Tax=Desulfobulbus alkaliphilus TaxID=869814 RepID=UPI00196462FB|nr:efflux RND transporter periplasmic adaptor subunit [Desulfobulbus alkaliphilus]MBM9537762.1 efflux RND transporter periplasmic adaptor subunit [Desulfobulbus alkaliphilus]
MKKTTPCLPLFLLVLAGMTILAGCRGQEQMPMAAPGPVEVDVHIVTTEPVNLSVELPGRTAAYRIAEVRPQVSGIVQKRLFTEGSEVQAGELLYQIDPATYQASLDSAKAALARAEAREHSARLKAERYRNLVRTKAVSEQDQIEMEAAWKEAEADVAAARAALDNARILLDFTEITAPITGRIGKSMVSEGALVTAQQTSALAVIQQLDPLFVDVNQSSTELLRLRREIAAGQPEGEDYPRSEVTVLLDDGSTHDQTGLLEFSDVTVNQSTGTVTLRAIVANPRQKLLPGMFVRARIAKGSLPDAVLIPAAAISRTNKGEAMVMVVDEQSLVATRMIEVGQSFGERTLITTGLNAGDRVIVAGLQKIRPGVPVTAAALTPPEPEQAAGATPVTPSATE